MGSDDLLKGEIRNKIAVANVTGIYYGYQKENDITGFNTSATAVGKQYGVTGAFGKPNVFYINSTGDVTFATAEAKAVSEIYKGNDGRYGFNAEAGAEAAALKGEVAVNIDAYGIFVGNIKAGRSLGAIGASAGLTAYWNTNDDSINVKVSGEMAFVLGIDADIDMKVSFEKILDWLYGDEDDDKLAASLKKGDGVILTGCCTVLIGN